jgi:hypothetical protein
MASDYEATALFAHRANIERYRKILRTYLTADEIRFIERRLEEEQAALQRLTGKCQDAGKSSHPV